MNTPTETLAERLTAHNAWRRGENEEQPVNATLLGKTLDHAASRLIAQHETMTKQTDCIAELERELVEVRGHYESALDSSRYWKAKADQYWHELEALKAEAGNDEQAELAAWELLRDANKDLASERALADRLAASLAVILEYVETGEGADHTDAHTAERALTAWKGARNE